MINYSRSSLSVISSILKYYGYDNKYQTIKELDELFENKPKTVVLLILDGLGSKILNYHSPNGFLENHKVADISSIFPSTTVAAINTFESGLPPYSHGWLGWSLYFKELNRYIDIFPYRDSISGEVVFDEGINGKTILKYQDVYSKIKESTNDTVSRYVFHPGYIFKQGDSFETYYSQSASDTFKLIKEFSKMNFPKYIYAYWADPDYTMHVEGTKTETITEIIKNLENGISENLANLDDTLIIITADHGLIDVGEYIDLSTIKELDDCLQLRPFIENRTTSYFVKKEKQMFFETEFNRRFQDDFYLLSKADVEKIHLFGEGKKHPKIDDFLGDYISVAKTDKCIIYNKGKKEDSMVFKAHHAGITDVETMVPLIVLSKQK